MKVTLSRQQWEQMGRTAGWIRDPKAASTTAGMPKKAQAEQPQAGQLHKTVLRVELIGPKQYQDDELGDLHTVSNDMDMGTVLGMVYVVEEKPLTREQAAEEVKAVGLRPEEWFGA